MLPHKVSQDESSCKRVTGVVAFGSKTFPNRKLALMTVKVRVLLTGICGIDLHIYKWDAWAQSTIPVPLVIGHEFVGEIAAVGSNVSDFRVENWSG